MSIVLFIIAVVWLLNRCAQVPEECMTIWRSCAATGRNEFLWCSVVHLGSLWLNVLLWPTSTLWCEYEIFSNIVFNLKDIFQESIPLPQYYWPCWTVCWVCWQLLPHHATAQRMAPATTDPQRHQPPQRIEDVSLFVEAPPIFTSKWLCLFEVLFLWPLMLLTR